LQFDVHHEQVIIMNMKQGFNEKALEFLQRICKQMDVCKIVGCNNYDEDSALNSLVNIILQGLNGNIRVYSATVTELRACFRTYPMSINLTYLEEVFFNLDDSMFCQNKREGAHYIHAEKAKFDKSKIKCFRCGETGHMKKECPKANNTNKSSSPTNQKSLDQITCFICSKKGHYATKCPQRSKSKSVTI
jgi:hypothetical protein